MCSWPAMAHKDNWPENTWTSHQGPTLAIISPRGTICKMNTLIKKAMCVHALIHANVGACVQTHVRKSISRQGKYMAAQMLVFQSKCNVLFMMFDCGCVLVYLHISLCL